MLRILALASLPSLLAAQEDPDPCTCLNWKEVYANKLTACGEGREFGDVPNMTYEIAFYHEYLEHGDLCKNLCSVYTKMDNNYCVNSELNLYDEVKGNIAKQWCYVSDQCTELNGGFELRDQESFPEWFPIWLHDYHKDAYQIIKKYLHYSTTVPRHVAVKFCKSGADTLTREMSIDQTRALAEKYDLRVRTFMEMVYASSRTHFGQGVWDNLWEDIRDHLHKDGIKNLPAKIRKAMENKDPIILDTDGHHKDDSFRMLVGNEVHKFDSTCPGLKPEEICPPKYTADHWKYRKGHSVEL